MREIFSVYSIKTNSKVSRYSCKFKSPKYDKKIKKGKNEERKIWPRQKGRSAERPQGISNQAMREIKQSTGNIEDE